jgi:serine/threonine protein kinase
MPDAMIHPTVQELTDFGLGKLPEHAAAAVAAHLEICPACRQAVAKVPADSFLNKVRAAGPAGSSFPPSLAQPGNAAGRASRPAIPNVPCPDVLPELARHPKYLILRELNRGGMGVVYQARHKEMGRQIVIKVIKRSLLDQPGALDRFRREIRAAAQLSHPNIVTAYDAEQAGDTHLLVMEFVPGQSLAEVLEKKGPLPVEKACRYVRQAAAGLHHAYKRNMVHRDIKPSNLMLTPQGQVKILDFGLAKIVSESGTRSGITESDTYMGTPEYSAPEQAQDARSADIRADIYSLGCTLYCLLAGRPPFREDTAIKTVLAHIEKQPQPLTELRPDVPERLWRVTARLLAKEPKMRYQKPSEVMLALAPFVKPSSKVGTQPPQDTGAPLKETVIERESEIEKIVREVPGNAPPKIVPAREDPSTFADLTDPGTNPMPSRPAWWKRPGVLAGAFGASLALIVMAVVIYHAVKEQTSDTDKNQPKIFNKREVVEAPHGPRIDDDAGKAPPEEPEEKPRPLNKRLPDPDPPKDNDKPEEQPAAPPPVDARPPAIGPGIEKQEPAANPPLAEAKKPSAVDAAIEKGVAALRTMQRADGTWPPYTSKAIDSPATIGATALAGLTLLECGAKPDDNAVLRAADALRQASVKLTHNYSISLAILFFDRLGDPNDIPLIESLAVRLLAGQSITGGWNYYSPAVPDAEVRRLQGILAERKVDVQQREMPKPGGTKRTAKDLPKEIQQQLALLQRNSGKTEGTGSDNSNTKFAMLALWVARRYGLPVENALKRVGTRFRGTQHADGGWGYFDPNTKVSGQMAKSTASMTCAGLLGIAIADGAALEAIKDRKNETKVISSLDRNRLKQGLHALSSTIGTPQDGKSKPGDSNDPAKIGGRVYYVLWSLEHMAVALDQKAISKKDWFKWGVEVLLAIQQADGSWQGNYAECGADTCFALLFLKRSNLTPDLTALHKKQTHEAKPASRDETERERRDNRWNLNINAGGNRVEYVARLRGLGAILAIPVREDGDNREYLVVRDLSTRPARLLKEDVKKIQLFRCFDFETARIREVMNILEIRLPTVPSHFVAYFPENLEQKFARLEIDYLNKHHPNREVDGIKATTFRIIVQDGKYEPEVVAVQPK